ncbi:MAG: hypothetical protein RL404_2067 [Pseudomonadota bacterium]|jgi:hypothetical protein
MMNLSDLDVTTAGINFSVQPTFRFGNRRTLAARTCFISNQTLDALAVRRYCKSYLPEEIFRQLEKEITGAATRLALAGAQGVPLVVNYLNFNIADD